MPRGLAALVLFVCFIAYAYSAGDFNGIEQRMPDKTEEVMTVTRKFRSDIIEYCRGRCEGLVAVELGCYHGHTTAVLSRLFARVFVLDNSWPHLSQARALNSDRDNIIYLRVDLYSGAQPYNWASLLSENDVHVVFVDASHLHRHVASDISAALSLPQVQTLIFDDYGVIRPVRAAINSYIEAGMLQCETIGEFVEDLVRVESINEARRFWSQTGAQGDHDFQEGGVAGAEREGLICQIVQRGPQPSWKQVLDGVHFDCYALNFAGRIVPRLEFGFEMNRNRSFLEVQRTDGSQQRISFKWSSFPHYHVTLQEVAPSLPPEIFFTPRLRSCTFARHGQPERFCMASEDMVRTLEGFSIEIASYHGV